MAVNHNSSSKTNFSKSVYELAWLKSIMYILHIFFSNCPIFSLLQAYFLQNCPNYREMINHRKNKRKEEHLSIMLIAHVNNSFSGAAAGYY